MNEYLFEGALSVKACLLAKKREVTKIMIDETKKSRDISFIIAKAKEFKVAVERVPANVIESMSEGKTHGGIICLAKERQYQQLEDLKPDQQFLCLLEGIEDPFNFGYCLRSLYAAGCDAVLVGERNWFSASPTITKSSAGASEYLDIIVCRDFGDTLQQLKQKGFSVYSAYRKDATNIYEVEYKRPLVLAIGGERRGLSQSVLTNSDEFIYIPYAREVRNALNSSSATSIISYVIARQHCKW